MATGIRSRLLFLHLRTSESDRLIVYFLRVSDVKISDENSECLIGIKSHIEFHLTYSLPQSELLRSFETTCFAGRAKLAIMVLVSIYRFTVASYVFQPIRDAKMCHAICEQQRCRSACVSAQSDQHLCCSLLRLYDMYTCYIQRFKILHVASFCS